MPNYNFIRIEKFDAHVNALWDHYLTIDHMEHVEEYLLHQARKNSLY